MFSKVLFKYWREISLCILLLVVIGKYSYDQKQFEAAYGTSQESMEKQIAELKEIHRREIELREEVIDKYRDTLIKLEQNYLEAQVELEKEREASRFRYIEDFSGDQKKIVNDIKEIYGFTYEP